MKTKIWVLSTCVPGSRRPSMPHTFGTEAEARAAFDEFMRAEWEYHAPVDDDDERLPFPDGDPAEANRLMSSQGYMWGEWDLTSHEVEVPIPQELQDELAVRDRRVGALMQTCDGLVKAALPQAFRDLLALAQGLDEFRDDYRMNAVLRACEAIVEGHSNG